MLVFSFNRSFRTVLTSSTNFLEDLGLWSKWDTGSRLGQVQIVLPRVEMVNQKIPLETESGLSAYSKGPELAAQNDCLWLFLSCKTVGGSDLQATRAS